MNQFILADTEVQYDISSKKDRMVTVYVPFDCKNKCKFCTSKGTYRNGTDKEKILKWLRSFRDSSLTEIVFTGGEPLEDLESLKEMLEIVSNKNVYINTLLPEKSANEFIEFTNTHSFIKGINISRHYSTFKHDQLNNGYVLAEDDVLSKFKCNVRINIVLNEINRKQIIEYIERWKKVGKRDLDVTFREDYNKVTINNLHDLENETICLLSDKYEYFGQIYCHACDKILFKDRDFGGIIRYHRGLNCTRVRIGNVIEMQELVLFPNGELCSDWDRTTLGLKDYLKELKIEPIE